MYTIKNPSYGVLVLYLAAMFLQGCARTMMVPPTLYTTGQVAPFEQVPIELAGSRVDVLYVTDRREKADPQGKLVYGNERSPFLAYGSAVVEFGRDLAWDDVIAFSRGAEGISKTQPIGLATFEELGRFPATPYLFEVGADGRVEPVSEITAEVREAEAEARGVLARRLSLTPRKEVFLFVHGVGNDFNDAVLGAAEMWHYLGRIGVPMAYTWPAGAKGLFFYTADRESGEYTVLHLKQLLRFLADTAEIEKLHILSHSRGTDVVMTALRELIIESRAAGVDPRLRFRIENVILLAADLDLQVASQRIAGEALGPAFGRLTIYSNAEDNAISASKRLFNSRLRLGALTPSQLTQRQREVIERSANLDIIIYEGAGGGVFGHSYYRNPAISSDLLMVLRNGWRPGEAGRRTLKSVGGNMWKINDAYLVE